jgi:hypothetical protein
MTRSPQRLVGMAAALVAVLWIGYGIVGRFYLKPVGKMDDEIARLEGISKRLNREMDNWIPVKKKLDAFGATLLSKEFDQTEHRLRTTLQEIGLKAGLGEVRVSSSPPKAVRTPLAEARLRGRMLRKLSDARDFAVIRGSFTGVGSLEQASMGLAYLQRQPWLHRIDRVTIEPRGRDRSAFELDVGFSVVFAPDLCPDDAAMPVIVEPSEDAVLVARAVAQRNVFVPPAPPPVPVAVPTPVDPTPISVPAGPAYDRWRVTGLVERRRGDETVEVEAWVLNLDSGEQRVLEPGDEVLGLVLVWVSGECGLFEIDGQRVVIHQGQTLGDRASEDSVDCPGIDGVKPMTGARTGEGE